MEPQYDHTKYESDIYKKWEDSDAFSPKPEGRNPFTIIMPPPNANDPLHIGHARFIAIEDILVRYHRMKGEPTLWLPGSDHAGIETQFVFEKKLKEKDQSRFDFDRDTLYKMIWDYVQDNTGVMESQLKKLGASCDWTRFKYTLDPKIVIKVYKTFKKLYDDGLIYRGERIVNYCPRCGTAYSQLEVDYVERDDNFYYLDYGTVTVATTRPETIFADVAIAVNPKDQKYQKLIGKTANIPLINREIPIIEDNLVDISFGTGALKITPAHDPTDFEIGQDHKLPLISVIDEKGRMTGTPERYVGMKAEVARAEVVKDLQAAGKIKKIEMIHHTIGTCYKDHGLIEPMVSKQWFIKVDPLTKTALAAIKEKEVRFAVKRYEKIAVNWLKNLRDWNISRQIVWGMRIPAWRCQKCLEWTITDGAVPDKCSQCGNSELVQDTDTFDTWFSSGQWPFATLQTTQKGDFNKFYPTSVMETAYDIIPFWVIRMIMLGLYATGKVPFEKVVIHGLVRDREGQKISKSKGNVINPIEMVEKYGADSLRMGLIWGGLIENDITLDEQKINGQRKFANKIWNIARFVTSNQSVKDAAKNADDGLILSELKQTIKNVSKDLDKFRLNEAAQEVYDFVWHKFADIYIEKTKDRREEAQPTLEKVLTDSVKLLHPFMPFVTEQIWHEMGNKDLLISSSWPKV
ncbi:MAG TPA: valine--tRNA ligase [Candidatus Saccharimonadales bacterium]|jgi:valyl-tRNA synthetase|nr:valine--tRNA ligase [Candidatus Saccharimonadales bacterium]